MEVSTQALPQLWFSVVLFQERHLKRPGLMRQACENSKGPNEKWRTRLQCPPELGGMSSQSCHTSWVVYSLQQLTGANSWFLIPVFCHWIGSLDVTKLEQFLWGYLLFVVW